MIFDTSVMPLGLICKSSQLHELVERRFKDISCILTMSLPHKANTLRKAIDVSMAKRVLKPVYSFDCALNDFLLLCPFRN
jgi:hypothetical protein